MAKNKNNVEPEKKKKGGFGKFCKGLFVIISLVAMAGCGFFGYMYFKDRIPTGKISFAQAKELVYTAAYDLGYINSTKFQHDLEKEPLAKPTNDAGKFSMYKQHASQVKSNFDEFENYSGDDVYTIISYDDYVNYFRFDEMQDILQLFAFDELQEGKSYKLDSYSLAWHVQLEKDAIVFTSWDINGKSYDDPDWGSQENVYKFTILESSATGIASYKMSYKRLDISEEDSLYLSVYSLTVGKAKVGGNRCFTSVSSAVIHVFYPGLIMGEDDLKTVGTSNMFLLGFDLDINQDYILAAKQEAGQITDRITVNKVIDAFVDDEHIHVDALKYYKNTSVTNLF